MKKTLTFVLSVLLTVVIVLTFAACNEKKEEVGIRVGG